MERARFFVSVVVVDVVDETTSVAVGAAVELTVALVNDDTATLLESLFGSCVAVVDDVGVSINDARTVATSR